MIIFATENSINLNTSIKLNILIKNDYLPRKEVDEYVVTHLKIIVKIIFNITSLLRGSFILIINLMIIWLVYQCLYLNLLTV